MNLPAILLALISATVIFCGCSEKEKAETPKSVRVVAFDKMQYRNDTYYEANQTIPFTGLSQEFYPAGRKKSERSHKDGKQHGAYIEWHENGQKKFEAKNYNDGKPDGLATQWHDNGKKKEECSYRDGKKEGLLTWWRANGQKMQEGSFKGGELDGL